jgi:hypothetical protein
MIVLWFLAGVVIGVISGLTQQWTVGQVRTDSSRTLALLMIGGFILRLGLAALVLYAAVLQGVAEVLLAFAGLWIARWGLSIYWHKSRQHSRVK